MEHKQLSIAELQKLYGKFIKITDLMNYLGLTRHEVMQMIGHPKIVKFRLERHIIIFSKSLQIAGFLD